MKRSLVILLVEGAGHVLGNRTLLPTISFAATLPGNFQEIARHEGLLSSLSVQFLFRNPQLIPLHVSAPMYGQRDAALGRGMGSRWSAELSGCDPRNAPSLVIM
jgi:hypothetical protein